MLLSFCPPLPEQCSNRSSRSSYLNQLVSEASGERNVIVFLCHWLAGGGGVCISVIQMSSISSYLATELNQLVSEASASRDSSVSFHPWRQCWGQ